MSSDDTAKVTPARLRRDAYLYIRQSTLYQVINNTGSTGRQYDLKSRAVTLGWPEDKIHVIDVDQGRSGASAADRAGFQHLVAEVSLGRAGIVLGLEWELVILPASLIAGPRYCLRGRRPGRLGDQAGQQRDRRTHLRGGKLADQVR